MFTFILRTPLTGCSQLAVSSAFTKGEVTATTLAGRAWTWVSCEPLYYISEFVTSADQRSPTASFIVPVAEVATEPAPGSLRLLAARPPPPSPPRCRSRSQG